ncbi:hypothetical protein B0H17DRAFT_1089831, partial [Mycena rosella]
PRQFFSFLQGARNGFVYGVKVRFPHALVMSILFGRGDWQSRLRTSTVLRNNMRSTSQSLYRSTNLHVDPAKGQRRQGAQLGYVLGWLLGGYIVFGERTAVNEQIVLYVVSRVVASFIPRAGTPPMPPDSRYFTLFAALSWGAVMWLFEHRGETIQPGMFNSMTYLYRDSNSWKNLKTLLWVNR